MYANGIIVGGIRSAQDHRTKAADEDHLAFRNVAYAGRVVDLDRNNGLWIFGHETIGDRLCETLWPAAQRPISGWANAWPTMRDTLSGNSTTTEEGGGPYSAPGGSIEYYLKRGQVTGDANRVNPPTGRPHHDVVVLPLNVAYTSDPRFRRKTITMGGTHKHPHEGNLGILIAGTVESKQDDVWMPTDDRLIARLHQGTPEYSTHVCDLGPSNKPDPARVALLHTLTHVIVDPHGLIPFGDNFLCLTGQHTGDAGSYAAMKDIATTASREAAVTGQPATSPYNVAPIPGTSNPPDRAVGDSQYAVGLMARRVAYGPMEVGVRGSDQHRIGVDADGASINSMHLSTDALFQRASYSPQYDGPLHFQYRPWPNPPPNPLRGRVHLTWDAADTHQWVSGQKIGKWKWYCEFAIGSGGGRPPPPTITPPGWPTPTIPPPPPPVPPTTPRDPVVPTGQGVPVFAGGVFGVPAAFQGAISQPRIITPGGVFMGNR